MGHRSALAGSPSAGLLLLFLGLVAMAALATLLLSAMAARGESGAPVLGGDGVWRSSGDWVVGSGDRLVYANMTVEASGNLTLLSDAHLTLSNMTLRFVGALPANRSLLVAAAGTLTVDSSTLDSQDPRLAVEVHGELIVSASHLVFAADPLAPSSLQVDAGRLSLVDTLVVSGAQSALWARAATVATLDTDFLTPGGAHAAVTLVDNGSYTFDTSGVGSLHTQAVGNVQFYSTVRFRLLGPDGNATAGHINGTGVQGQVFFADANATGRANALRLLQLSFAPGDGVQGEADRRSPLPLSVTAVAAGVGGNTTAFWIDAPRVNLTLVLDEPYDLAVYRLTVPDAELSARPRPVFYAALGSNVTVLIEVRNLGPLGSPAATLALTQWAADPSSFVNRESRAIPSLAVPALPSGQSVNLSFLLAAEAWGGQEERRTDCFHSLSYSTNLQARVTGAQAGDYGPWDDQATISLRAFVVEGNETAPCGGGGEALAPYIVLATGAAIAGAWAVNRTFSSHAEERRAAKAIERQQQQRQAGGPPPPEKP